MELGIIVVTFALMVCAVGYFWRLHSHMQLVASILTILGVLGTFVGIAYALYLFDADNIEMSIPQLLGGLKIAFLTSIGGIGFSVLLKVRSAHQRKKVEKRRKGAGDKATIGDLINALFNVCSVQQEEGKRRGQAWRPLWAH